MVMSALTVSILFSTRSRKLENMMRAAGDADVLDRKRIGIALPAAGFARRYWLPCSRSRRSGKFATGRMMTSSVICGLPAHRLRERHLGLDARGREVAVDVAVLRILQRDVVQRDVERRPQADLGAAVDGELVAGLALDPLLDLRRQEARRDADHQQQRDDDDHGARWRRRQFSVLSYRHSRPRKRHLISVARDAHATGQASLSRKGMGPRSQKYSGRTAKLCDL